jgi:FkbM family methyltransferase
MRISSEIQTKTGHDLMGFMRRIAKAVVPASIVQYVREKRDARCKAMDEAEREGRIVSLLSTSQAGQDYWVYGEVFNEKRNGFFLDIGAHDGIYLSNTLLLERRYGWNGVCIEGNPDTFRELKQNRQVSCINTCVDRIEGTVLFAKRGVLGGIVARDCDNKDAMNDGYIEVVAKPLADILKNAGAPYVIDYLSIDIEGAEDRALLDFPFNLYKFRCITIERPSVHLRERFKESGYVLIRELPGLDCFYVHETFVGDHHQNLIAFHEKSFKLFRV